MSGPARGGGAPGTPQQRARAAAALSWPRRRAGGVPGTRSSARALGRCSAGHAGAAVAAGASLGVVQALHLRGSSSDQRGSSVKSERPSTAHPASIGPGSNLEQAALLHSRCTATPMPGAAAPFHPPAHPPTHLCHLGGGDALQDQLSDAVTALDCREGEGDGGGGGGTRRQEMGRHGHSMTPDATAAAQKMLACASSLPPCCTAPACPAQLSHLSRPLSTAPAAP